MASVLRRKVKVGELSLDTASPKERLPEFSDFAQRYLDEYARRSLKRTTCHGYATIIDRHLNPAWKGKRLDEITRSDVKQLLAEKQQAGFATGTVENIKALISGLFTFAYEDEIITSNPALKLGRFIHKQDHRRHIQPLTRDEATSFLRVSQQEFPQHYPLLLTAFRTGMRLGELLGLAWTDVDFQGNRITVQRAYTHGWFSTPKSNKSRVVDMSDQLKAVLLDHRESLLARFGGQLSNCVVPGPRGNDYAVHLVFPSETGGPLCGDNFRSRVFYKLLEKADVPRFRFHDIRHTFASMLLANSEPLHYVREQMGHASIQTTVDVYGHLVPGSNRNAVNRLDDPHLRVVPAVG